MNSKLTSLKQKVQVANYVLELNPFTLETMDSIRNFFATEEEPDGMKTAQLLIADNDVKAGIQTLWFFVVNKEDFEDIDHFTETILKEERDPLKIYTPIKLAMTDGKPDVEFGQTEISKKKVVGTLMLLLLAGVGLIHTISWAVVTVPTLLKSFYS